MYTRKNTFSRLIWILPLLVIISSCNGVPGVGKNPTATPTPTKAVLAVPPTQTETPSRCAGLAGELEVQVLVGPAEVVGLEPYSVGTIPFAVTSNEEPFILQGGGGLAYSDVLTKEWGTYQVTLNLQLTISGECDDATPAGELAIGVEMDGSQMVVVTAEGFQGEYPWEGTHSLDLNFPLEEGASFSGDGYTFVLHLQ